MTATALACVSLDCPSRMFHVDGAYPVVGTEGAGVIVLDDLGHRRFLVGPHWSFIVGHLPALPLYPEPPLLAHFAPLSRPGATP